MAKLPKVEGTSVSKTTFFATIVIVAIVAFALGTRGNDILAAIGPTLGFTVPHGQIDLSSVEKTYQQLNANFDGKLDTQKLIDGANEGLVAAAGDKFTVYLSAKDAKAFSNDLTGNVGAGIGAEISERNDQPTITEILPDNPAGKAGLLAGDTITAINGSSTNGWSSDKVASAIRGQAGTTVKVTVSRSGASHSYSITRATINDPSVTSKVTNGIGVMTISRFDDNTGSLAKAAAENFVSQHVKGVVVDLRDNGGGYVDAAQAVASLWLDNKTVVTEKTHGVVTSTVTSDSDPILGSLPTVILVNGNTASASEIVSGALRDYHKAELIGTQTYGKGTMQEILSLGGGSELKVTIAHWYMPNGKSVEHVGLKPDKIVQLTANEVNAGQDPQMAAAMAALN
ncbi:MAG TPA: S41 family peptidase [Candidatus Saccharimonadaceae bacterium]|nr:S41 family peptidase [Candidatus Saccharimonadaceae bacterium]